MEASGNAVFVYLVFYVGLTSFNAVYPQTCGFELQLVGKFPHPSYFFQY